MQKQTLLQGTVASLVGLFLVFSFVLPFSAEAQYTGSWGYQSQNSLSGGSSGGTYGGTSGSGTYYKTVATSLNVSCAPTPTLARIGESVLWFSSVTGGSGNYTYFWSGTDGITGNSSSIRTAYGTTGSKYATVTVISAGQSITVNCTAPVTVIEGTAVANNGQNGGRFGVSCYSAEGRIAPNESGAWLSVSTGLSANATTTYEWTGTDGLTGNGPLAFKTYTTNGRKFALLTVTSGGLRNTVACTNQLVVAPRTPAPVARLAITVSAGTTTAETFAPVQGVCTPSDEKTEVGKVMSWQVASIGGDGTYAYIWSGDEALSGTASTTAITYKTAGKKNASVIISSAHLKATATCPEIEVVPKGSGLFASGLFSYLFYNPWWLILIAIGAGVIALLFAIRKRRKEEAEAEEKEKEKKH